VADSSRHAERRSRAILTEQVEYCHKIDWHLVSAALDTIAALRIPFSRLEWIPLPSRRAKSAPRLGRASSHDPTRSGMHWLRSSPRPATASRSSSTAAQRFLPKTSSQKLRTATNNQRVGIVRHPTRLGAGGACKSGIDAAKCSPVPRSLSSMMATGGSPR